MRIGYSKKIILNEEASVLLYDRWSQRSYAIQTTPVYRHGRPFHDEGAIHNSDEYERAKEAVDVDVIVQGLQRTDVCSTQTREGIRT
jgi:hypothetical protein